MIDLKGTDLVYFSVLIKLLLNINVPNVIEHSHRIRVLIKLLLNINSQAVPLWKLTQERIN